MTRCVYWGTNEGARLLGVLPASHAERKCSYRERAVIVLDGETSARVVYLSEVSFERELAAGEIP
jgi:hypothetical protein